MPQKRVPHLLFSIDRMHIEQVTEFNFLGLIIDSNLNWKAHLSAIGTKISRVIGLLHKLKYIFPKQVLHSIYNSLIMRSMCMCLAGAVANVADSDRCRCNPKVPSSIPAGGKDFP